MGEAMDELVRRFAREGVSRRDFVRQCAALGFTTAATGKIAAAWDGGTQSVVRSDTRESLKFAVISDVHALGDHKEYAVAQELTATYAAFPFEMVITSGDNVNGTQDPREYVDKFEKPFGALLDAGVPFYATLGNHDSPSIRFYSPWNMGGNRYYTFARKNARFFVLDTNEMNPLQLAWIDDALKSSHEDWKICFLHHPPYSDGKTHGSDLGVRALLEPIFVEHGVNVVFTGHDHIYERITPQKGIAWFVTGGAGPVRKGDTQPSSMTAAHFDQDESFMVAEIQDDNLVFQAISRTGKNVDTGVIQRRATL
jgi:3',5'-cyclic AMP phosphodiesterase CpdA